MADQLHLVEGLLEHHRLGRVDLLPHHERSVAHHRDGPDVALDGDLRVLDLHHYLGLAGQGLRRSRLGGVRTAAEIVNLMSTSVEEEAIAHVREQDEALAQRIVDEMFVFENLLGLEDRSIQRLLKDIESDSLIIALKGAPMELRDKFLNNMSQRAAETLREDMELRGPVRVSQVETEQKAILQVARRLAEAGEIVIATPGTDEFV